MESSHRRNLSLLAFALAIIAFGLNGEPCNAQTAASSGTSFGSAIVEYFTDWFPRVTRIQSEQPGWVTPLVTVTPRLEEEFRYDQVWQGRPYGAAEDIYGNGKGLELIPFQNTEIILGVPAWNAHTGAIRPGGVCNALILSQATL
jgi:hypothetical protein